MITLSDGTTTVSLSPDLAWADEFAWSPVQQSTNYTVTGALVVRARQRQAGRPITLAYERDDRAWMPRSVVDQCRTWAAIAGQQLTLSLRGSTRTVIWRHQDGAIDATPVVPGEEDQPQDNYRATLRFLEI